MRFYTEFYSLHCVRTDWVRFFFRETHALLHNVKKMASYQNSPYNKILFESVRRPSESQSEISSVDSDWSDIKSIALKLGVANADDLISERFKVDRQKLESMIQSECVFVCILAFSDNFLHHPLHNRLHVPFPIIQTIVHRMV